jgi:hypothetical protein
MRKSILGLMALFAVAVAAVVNVNLGTKTNDLTVISLVNAEILAYGENENNHWTDWFDQGFTKDEYSERKQCTITTGWSIDLGFWSYDNHTTTEGYKTVCFNGGYANCTSTDCQ